MKQKNKKRQKENIKTKQKQKEKLQLQYCNLKCHNMTITTNNYIHINNCHYLHKLLTCQNNYFIPILCSKRAATLQFFQRFFHIQQIHTNILQYYILICMYVCVGSVCVQHVNMPHDTCHNNTIPFVYICKYI